MRVSFFEDGFYDGRNLDGRYGLVPSNFIELVTNPQDLPEHTKQIIHKLTGRTFERNLRSSLESDVFTPTLTKQRRRREREKQNKEHYLLFQSKVLRRMYRAKIILLENTVRLILCLCL